MLQRKLWEAPFDLEHRKHVNRACYALDIMLMYSTPKIPPSISHARQAQRRGRIGTCHIVQEQIPIKRVALHQRLYSPAYERTVCLILLLGLILDRNIGRVMLLLQLLFSDQSRRTRPGTGP
jgi:hypothetical protein